MFEQLEPILSKMVFAGLRVVIIAGGAYVVIRVLRLVVRRMVKLVPEEDVERCKRFQTLARILNSVVFMVLAAVALLMILKEVGMEIGPLLAAAGLGGLAIGFGAQYLIRDLINGFFILLEDQYRIGDVVQAAGVSGLVESMNLRVTVLRDLAGTVHTIPNGEIKVVSNMSKEWSRCVLDVGVAYKEDLERVMEVIREAGGGMLKDARFADDILEPLEILGVEELGDSAVVIKVMVKTRALRQWAVGRELRKRIKVAFDRHGIEIPFPHRTLYWGEGAKP